MEADSRKPIWEPHGVGLDRAPYGVVKATDVTLRGNTNCGSKVWRSNYK